MLAHAPLGHVSSLCLGDRELLGGQVLDVLTEIQEGGTEEAAPR